MIQCKTPVTPWCNSLSLAAKRPVWIKSPITRIQYLWEVPGFRSVGHIFLKLREIKSYLAQELQKHEGLLSQASA